MSCQRCESERIMDISAKCSDCCIVSMGDKESDGYVTKDAGIGGGDYVEMRYCLNCGQIQGEWPKPPTSLESEDEDEDFDHE